jgi:hypothetical protein
MEKMKMKTVWFAAAAVLICLSSAHAAPGQPIEAIGQCNVTVNNPTDPTLNARTRPNGPIVAVFGNGEIVNTYDRVGDWVFVMGAISDQNGNTDKQGWVFGSYLRSCRPAAG